MAFFNEECAPITMLLVPGACFTRQHFLPFAQYAVHSGIDITICDLVSANSPGGTQEYDLDVLQVAHELALLLGQDRKVVIVAHSYGGLPACDAVTMVPRALTGALLGLIFTSAFVPQMGKSLRDLRVGRDATLFEFRGTQCSIANAPAVIFNEVDEPSRTHFAQTLVPHNPAVFAAPAASNTWKLFPAAYIKCGKDKALVPEEQEANVSRMESGIVSELQNGDHFPFGSCPEQLLTSILDICYKFEAADTKLV